MRALPAATLAVTALATAALVAACSADDGSALAARPGAPVGDSPAAGSSGSSPSSPEAGASSGSPPSSTGTDASAVPGVDASTSDLEAKGIFVAVGYGGRRIRSIDDGKTWTDDVSAVAHGGDDDMLLRTVVHTNGAFVGLGYRAVSSVDGKTWQPFSPPFGQWIGAATWAQGHFVAVGGYGLRATSANGTSWSDKPIDTVASHAHDSLAWSGARFASANDAGVRTTSADGVTWVASTGAAGIASTAMAYGNGVFVGLGDANAVRSTDGGATFGSLTALAAPCRGLVFAQGHFTALADGHAFTSTDGLAWVDHPSPTAHRGLVAYGHGTFVVLADQGRQRSVDGLVWEAPISDGSANPLEALVFGPL